jgi:hypothetical protein
MTGGSGRTTTHEESPKFLFTHSTKDGDFSLALPRGRTWCFFAVGDYHLAAYWFKRQTFLMGRTVSLSRVCYSDGSEFQGDKNDFFRYILATEYGLAIASDEETGETHGEINGHFGSPLPLVPRTKSH